MVRSQPKKPSSFAARKQSAKLEAVKKIIRVARQHRLGYEDFVYVCQQARIKLKLKKPRKERKLPEILSLAELKKFFKTVQKCGDLQYPATNRVGHSLS
jgi:integrase